MDDTDLAACLNQINKNLEKISFILGFKFLQMWTLIGYFRVNFCFDFNFQIFFDLDDDVTIDCLTLVKRFVLMELQYDGNLGLVGHRQNEPFIDVLIVHIVAIRSAMQSEIFLVKIDCVFSPRHC